MGVTVEKLGKVTIITIDRPEAMNAIDLETNEGLNQAWDDFNNDPEQWVAVLTGAGEKSFCAGADLKKFIAPQSKLDRVERRAQLQAPHGHIGGINRNFTCYKPMIAAINGHCMGIGFEMALACDIRICSENATFAFPEAKWGILPGAGGTQRLVRTIPLSFAMEMLLDCRKLNAQEALSFGVVSRVVPQAELRERAIALAQSICEKGPLATRLIKEAVMHGRELPLADGLRMEAELRDFLMGTEDAKEGPLAFAEKRKPNFKAR